MDAFEALLVVLGTSLLLFGVILLLACKYPTEGADEE